MDELAAHCDRGWDLLQKGDFAGALLAVQELLRLDKDAPEAHVLEGAVHAAQALAEPVVRVAQDKAEQALLCYERAMMLDPKFVDPPLCAAEVYAFVLERYEEALELVDKALELAVEEDEFTDALLLKAEVELLMEDGEAARETLGDLSQDFPDVAFHVRAARVILDLGEIDPAFSALATAEAQRHYCRILARDPSQIEALEELEERLGLQAPGSRRRKQ